MNKDKVSVLCLCFLMKVMKNQYCESCDERYKGVMERPGSVRQPGREAWWKESGGGGLGVQGVGGEQRKWNSINLKYGTNTPSPFVR